MTNSCFESFRALFTSQEIGEARLVWDPMVHKQQDEDCWIILLRFGDRPRGGIKNLDAILDQLGFRGPCVYLLFGYYDVLLRIWGSRSRVERLELRLKEMAEELSIYNIHKVFYDDWTRHQPDIDAHYLDRFEDDIRQLSSVSLASEPPKAKKALARLINARLVHVLDPTRAGFERSIPLVKAYIALVSTGEMDHAKQLDIVRSVFSEISGLELKSIYWAKEAHIAVFVKVVVASTDFFGLDRSLQELERVLGERDARLRIMTLVIANNDAIEADLVATDVPETSGALWERLTRQVSPEGQRCLAEGSRDFLDRMHDLYRLGRTDSLYKPFEKHFAVILDACAQQDSHRLRSGVSCIGALEKGLRGWLVEVLLPSVFGTDWWQPLREVLGVQRLEFSLGQLEVTLGKVSALDETAHEAINRMLSSEWQQILQRVRPVRNDVLHGNARIDWAASAAGDASWYEIAAATFGVAGMYNELDAWIEDYPNR